MRLFTKIINGTIRHPLKDIAAGIIVALVSIPISMGYAQIAGLPVVYGLYGSFLPILIYGLMTTSPQFVVGVDAMPAAMVGGLLSTIAISPESDAAMNLVPVVSFMVALWFVVFYFLKAGRVVKYISSPVMSGFISGVGVTIILMQIPKLYGGSSGTGVLGPLLLNIWEEFSNFNIAAAILGIGTVAVILICKKKIPKVPMTVIMMGVGALLQVIFRLDRFGVKLLPEVAAGLPKIFIPDIMVLKGHVVETTVESLSISAVIMAQTLLATGSYAQKYGDEVDNNKELLAYAGMNVAGGLVGCCPVNGSVSRSGIADSFGCRSQIMSITSGISMVLVLLFGTPYLKYLPIPVLTGIVMTALIGIIDTKMFKRLWDTSRNEFVIFVISFVGVLFLGTVNGVIVGCLLSFGEVAVRAVVPPATFVGRIPGHGNFHSLSRNSHARPIENTLIYRFSGNLFFANIDKFENDIENAIKPDTHIVVVDARGIGTIDITAVDRLLSFARKLKGRDVRFYITEHESSLNDQLRTLGGGELIDKGVVRRTITLALRDAGLEKPYKLEGVDSLVADDFLETEENLAEFEWAFGSEAEDRLKVLALKAADAMTENVKHHDEHIPILENHGATTEWGMLGLFDEQEFWDLLEERLEELLKDGRLDQDDIDWIEQRIEDRREKGIKRLNELNPLAIKTLNRHRERILKRIKERDPEGYEHLRKIAERIRENESRKAESGENRAENDNEK